MKRFLFFLFLLVASCSNAAVLVLSFTPYNCSTAGYDTSVHFRSGDRIIFVNHTTGPFSASFFCAVNGVTVDTVSAAPGDTLMDRLLSPTDTLITIHVWTMPGMCYGQRFHLELTTDAGMANEIPLWNIRGRFVSFSEMDTEAEMVISDIQGRPLAVALIPARKCSVFRIPSFAAGIVLISIRTRWRSCSYLIATED
ncbi:MAG: hypothetical protein ACKOQ6_07780 [Bacteroidota bacterium]